MLQFLQFLLPSRLLQPVLRPLTRLFLGLIAVPMFRFAMRKVVRVQEIDEELERDLELWFRGSLLLLIATANMEPSLFGWVPYITGNAGQLEIVDGKLQEKEIVFPWYVEAGRILLAIGVIEGMPDQALFALIHPGPRKPDLKKGQVLISLFRYLPELLRGLICQHLNRSSPVFAILTVLHDGQLGWICYGIAITQYLIIGLVASKDKAFDVLQQIDQAMLRQRDELESELHLKTAARNLAKKQLRDMDPKLDSF